MQSFKDYYYGYESVDGRPMPGYVEMIEDLTTKFPLTEPQIIGEQNQKDFIALFGAILRMRNLLVSFDEFMDKELLTERDLQDYLGRYQDLRDEWKRKRENSESTDITDDIVFEIELIKQIEINIDYILMLVKKYHDSHGEDKEILVTIKKAVDASPELRSKKALIESFIAGVNDIDDVMDVWHDYVIEMKTDNKKLFEYSLVTFSQNDYIFDEVNLDLYTNLNEDNIQTEYEKKFVNLGMPIYKLRVIHKICKK